MGQVLSNPGGLTPDLLVLVGPTGVGKTAVAIQICQQLPVEIVNADSMQVYHYMDIGTAKPTEAEQEKARFHLIDIATPDHQVTVSEWKHRAEEAITQIRNSGKIPIVCGGTGLYVRALLDDWKLAETPADPELRASLQARAASSCPGDLHRELAGVDPVAADRLHPNDFVRIVRALEVYYTTGVAISDLQRNDRVRGIRRPARLFGLTLPRPELYERIEHRVDQMLAAGLQGEVRRLLSQGYSPELSSMRCLGYKEMVQYVSGQMDWSATVSAIKQYTCRYAKRQLTWFRGDTTIEWIDVSALDSATVASTILSMLENEPGNKDLDEALT